MDVDVFLSGDCHQKWLRELTNIRLVFLQRQIILLPLSG